MLTSRSPSVLGGATAFKWVSVMVTVFLTCVSSSAAPLTTVVVVVSFDRKTATSGELMSEVASATGCVTEPESGCSAESVMSMGGSMVVVLGRDV